MERIRQATEDFMQEAERRLAPGTIRHYRSALRFFTAACDEQGVTLVTDLTRPVLRAYAASLDGKLTPGGAHARLRVIRAFVNWLVQEELLARNPIPPHFFPKVPSTEMQVVTEDDMTRLLRAAEDGSSPLRNRAILFTLFDTGLRASELCGLHLDHILPDSTLYVRLGKGRKDRRVPISKPTRRALQQYITVERPATAHTHVFIGKGGLPLAAGGLLQLIERLAIQAGLPGKTPHAFRRGFAVSFIKHGADLVRLKDVLGHTTITMSARYAVMSAEDIKTLHRSASPVQHLSARRKRG